MYSKSIYNKEYLSIVKNLVTTKIIGGIFSNFKFFWSQNWIINPTVLIIFSFKEKSFIIKEAKRKNIPIISLIEQKTNTTLIDYPILLNSSYFHSVFFFSKFLFKFIFLLKK